MFPLVFTASEHDAEHGVQLDEGQTLDPDLDVRLP
jgi:hypothetical protein